MQRLLAILDCLWFYHESHNSNFARQYRIDPFASHDTLLIEHEECLVKLFLAPPASAAHETFRDNYRFQLQFELEIAHSYALPDDDLSLVHLPMLIIALRNIRWRQNFTFVKTAIAIGSKGRKGRKGPKFFSTRCAN